MFSPDVAVLAAAHELVAEEAAEALAAELAAELDAQQPVAAGGGAATAAAARRTLPAAPWRPGRPAGPQGPWHRALRRPTAIPAPLRSGWLTLAPTGPSAAGELPTLRAEPPRPRSPLAWPDRSPQAGGSASPSLVPSLQSGAALPALVPGGETATPQAADENASLLAVVAALEAAETASAAEAERAAEAEIASIATPEDRTRS